MEQKKIKSKLVPVFLTPAGDLEDLSMTGLRSQYLTKPNKGKLIFPVISCNKVQKWGLLTKRINKTLNPLILAKPGVSNLTRFPPFS